jgi:hypothetical protein
MKTPALAAFAGGADDKLGAHSEIAQFKRVGSYEVTEIVIAYFTPQSLKPARGAVETLVGSYDADVIPHKTANLVPHVSD